MFGMKAAAQYVVPASDIKSLNYAGSSVGGSVNPLFDGINYLIWDNGLKKAEPFITNTFSSVYTTSQLGNTTSRNNALTYENGRYFFTDFGAGRLYTWTTLGGTITTALSNLNDAPRIVKWYAAANCWVAVGSASRYWTSTDGTSWTEYSFAGQPGNMNALDTNGTILVAAGAGAAMFTTTSTSLPLTWTSRTSSFSTSNIFVVYYDEVNAYWMAGGQIGKTAYSTNGTTWTQVTTGAPVDQSIYGIVYHMGRWVVISEGGPDAKSHLMRSNTKLPTGGWTVVSTTEPSEGTFDQQIGKIFSDGKYIFWHPEWTADSGVANPRIRYCR